MRAVVYAGEGKVRVENVREPEIVEATDALVRASLCGICGTDLHLIGGEFTGMELGTVLGHEVVGDVIAVGSAIRSLRVGDRVFASDFVACGHCRWCDRGEHWECAQRAFFGSGRSFGLPLSGAQAEIVRVPFADVVLLPVPDYCSDEVAILLADNLPTGWAAIERSALRPGEVVAVIGGGPVGQLASLCAQSAGAGVVVLVEPSVERRRFAASHGALGVTPEEAQHVVGNITDGDGADVVIEAVGRETTLDQALRLVRQRGRIVSVGAHGRERWEFPLAKSFADEISLSFAIGDAIRSRRDLLSLVKTGALDPVDLIETHVAFENAPDAYAALQAQRAMKIVIDPARR